MAKKKANTNPTAVKPLVHVEIPDWEKLQSQINVIIASLGNNSLTIAQLKKDVLDMFAYDLTQAAYAYQFSTVEEMLRNMPGCVQVKHGPMGGLMVSAAVISSSAHVSELIQKTKSSKKRRPNRAPILRRPGYPSQPRASRPPQPQRSQAAVPREIVPRQRGRAQPQRSQAPPPQWSRAQLQQSQEQFSPPERVRAQPQPLQRFRAPPSHPASFLSVPQPQREALPRQIEPPERVRAQPPRPAIIQEISLPQRSEATLSRPIVPLANVRASPPASVLSVPQPQRSEADRPRQVVPPEPVRAQPQRSQAALSRKIVPPEPVKAQLPHQDYIQEASINLWRNLLSESVRTRSTQGSSAQHAVPSISIPVQSIPEKSESDERPPLRTRSEAILAEKKECFEYLLKVSFKNIVLS